MESTALPTAEDEEALADGAGVQLAGLALTNEDPDERRDRPMVFTGSGKRTESSGEPSRGVAPTDAGRPWAIARHIRRYLRRAGNSAE